MESWECLAPPDPGVQAIAVVGDAVEESRFPALLARAHEEARVEAWIVPLKVEQLQFEACIRHLAALGFRGAWVLRPHKADAARLAQGYYHVRNSVGVANVLSFEGGIYGQNTEVTGFLAPLRDTPVGTALVMGAGPAGRTVTVGLLQQGWRVKVWSRSLMKSRMLATTLRAFGTLEFLPEPDPLRCDLIVNATPIGARIGESLPVVWTHAMRGATAYDLVYRRVPTEFLRQARSRGFRVIDGLTMELESVALAFEWWYGQKVDSAALRAAVRGA